MRIVGINGSSRSNDALSGYLQAALGAAQQAVPGLVTECINLADHRVAGCIQCLGCEDVGRCGLNDAWNTLLPRLHDDGLAGIILATPVCTGSCSAQIKAFLDRSELLRRNGRKWAGLPAACLALGESHGCGQELALQVLAAAIHWHGGHIAGQSALLALSSADPIEHAQRIGQALASALALR